MSTVAIWPPSDRATHEITSEVNQSQHKGAVSRDASAPEQPMVIVRNVAKRFGATDAVSDVSFDVGRGKFLTILGPSGSGKTTVLRMIAGFLEPSAGEIFIHGQPVGSSPPHRRSIGMVFQRLALFPHMSAAENVAYPLKMRRFDAREIPARVDKYLDIVRLGGLGQRRIQELSGGQQQRVAIARALVFEPDLVLLDEPLASLDKKLREEMQLEFRRIQQDLGVTTINVTHDQREALVMSDEVLVMDHGRVQQRATPQMAYAQPANKFVAGFIGVTNFLSGIVEISQGDKLHIRLGDAVVEARWADMQLSSPQAGATVDCALRAEHLRVFPGAAALPEMDSSLAAHIDDVIFEGDRLVYVVRPDRVPEMVLRAFDAAAHDTVTHQVGAKVTLGWRRADMLAFPR